MIASLLRSVIITKESPDLISVLPVGRISSPPLFIDNINVLVGYVISFTNFPAIGEP